MMNKQSPRIRRRPREIGKCFYYTRRYLSYDYNPPRGRDTMLPWTLYMIKMLLFAAIRTIYWVIKALLVHTFKSIYHILDMAALILTFVAIIYWCKILSADTVVINADGSSPNAAKKIFEISQMRDIYLAVCAVNCIIRALCLVKHFGFSSKLSMFYEIMQSAGFDLIFFSLMFLVVMIGYSYAGTILFGVENKDFNSFGSSFLINIQLIIGSYKVNQIKSYYSLMIVAYCVTLFLVSLVLLNMFVAIIGSHYFEYYSDNYYSGGKGLIDLIIDRFLTDEIQNINQGKWRSDVKHSKSCYERSKKRIKYWIVRYWFYHHLDINKGKNKKNNQIKFKELNLPITNPNIHEYVENITDPLKIGEGLDSYRKLLKEHELDDMSLWVGMIERYTNQYVGNGYFFGLNSNDCIYNERLYLPKEVIRDMPDYRCEDNQINFLLVPMEQKLKIWRRASIDKKYLLWEAMEHNSEMLYNENDPDEEEKNEISQRSISLDLRLQIGLNRINESLSAVSYNKSSSSEEVSESSKDEVMNTEISQVQTTFWKETCDSFHDSSELWNNKFTWIQKVKLWNSLEYSREVFEEFALNYLKVSDLSDKSLFQKQTIASLDEFISYLFSKLDLIDQDSTRLKFNLRTNHFETKFFPKFKSIKEYKIYFFLRMSLDDQIRLFIHQKDDTEGNMMACLIHWNYDAIVPLLKEAEDKISNILDNRIYQKYIAFSEFHSLHAKLYRYEELLMELDEEGVTILEYIGRIRR